MQNSSPGDSPKCAHIGRPSAGIRTGYVLCAIFLCAIASSAQTLARPGWTASGFTADPWWKHAVFYRMTDPAPPPEAGMAPHGFDDPATIAARLDALQALRIDALILPMPGQQSAGPALDAFDELLGHAARRGIRIVLAVPASGPAPALSERARFWLSRGIAGIYVFTPAQSNPVDAHALVQAVRGVTAAAVGGRIVLSDLPVQPSGLAAFPPAYHRRSRLAGAAIPRAAADQSAAQLHLDSQMDLPELPDAATLRSLIAGEPRESSVVLDLKPPAPPASAIDPYLAILKSIAAIELTTHPVALVDADGALTPAVGSSGGTVSPWYRQLIALHHANATLRYGAATPLEFDAQNSLVWVSRAPQSTALMPPVIVACNLTSSPVHLSLQAATRQLGLRGSFLRTLLRTDDSMGPQDLNDISIPPFGVYIGELHR